MIEALISGERRGAVMADLARGRARTAGKLADLSMALEAAVADLEARIAATAADWQREIGLLEASHTAVVISAAEEPLGELRVRACAVQAERLLAWAAA